MASFHAYQHIEKLGSTGTQGLLDGTVYVFPKLDGTNAHIWLDDNLNIKFGSRRRELESGADNAGFMNDNKKSDDFMRGASFIFQSLGDVIVYGEWLVPHTIKRYRKEAWRHFYVFDIYDYTIDEYLPYDMWSDVIYDAEVESHGAIRRIPAIWTGDGSKIETPDALTTLCESASFMVDDGYGEGIVIKNYGYKNPYGNTVWGKVVAKDFLSEKAETHGKKLSTSCVEERIIAKFLDKSLIDKEWGNCSVGVIYDNDIADCTFKFHPRYYQQLFNRVWKTFLEEETYDFVKWSKNATVDFKRLYRCMTDFVKEYVNNGGLDNDSGL